MYFSIALSNTTPVHVASFSEVPMLWCWMETSGEVDKCQVPICLMLTSCHNSSHCVIKGLAHHLGHPFVLIK